LSARRPAPTAELRRPAQGRGAHSPLSLLYSRRVRGWFWQALTIIALAAFAWWCASNAVTKLARAGIPIGFGFLFQPAGFSLSEALIPFSGRDSMLRALAAGFLNTLHVALWVILLKTIMGVALGMGQLARNPLLRGLCGAWVEFVRNTPALVGLFFVYLSFLQLPGPRRAIALPGGAFLSNRGLVVPSIEIAPAVALAALVLLVLPWLATRRSLRPWRHALRLAGAAAAVALIVLAGAVERPTLTGFNFQGGITVSIEFTALVLALTLYGSAGLAEIVRGSVLAVPTGQWEAARALGLRDGRIFRAVIAPQALRIAIPPVTNAYVSTAKTTSLGVTIGYPELVNVTNTVIQATGQAIECVLVLMAVYLAISLVTSALMNAWNARSRIVER